MKIINLIGDTYQVVNDENTTTYFQGTIGECHSYLLHAQCGIKIDFIDS